MAERADRNVNPYAAPQTQPSFGSPGGPVHQGDPQPWDVGEVLRMGWQVFTTNWGPLTFGFMLAMVIGMLPGQVAPGLALAGVIEEKSAIYWALNAPLVIVGYVIQAFFGAGMTRMGLRTARGEVAVFSDVFSGGSRLLPYFLAWLLSTFAAALGAVALVVPGVIVMVGLSLASFYVIDQQLGPIEALRASWHATQGHKGSIFVFFLAAFAIILAGLFACCIGLFAAQGILLIAQTVIYLRLSGTGAPPDAAMTYQPGFPPAPPYPGSGGPGFGGPYTPGPPGNPG